MTGRLGSRPFRLGGNEWVLVGSGDFKSFCRARLPSEVGSIPTHSRHHLRFLSGRRPPAAGEPRKGPGVWAAGPFGTGHRVIRNRAQTARLAATAPWAALLCWLAFAPPARAQVAAAPGDSLEAEAAAAVADTAALRRLDPDLIDFRRAEPDLWYTGVSATGAVLMTPVFPGWGQLYAENSWRAGLAYGAQMYFWTNVISRDRQARRARDFAGTFPEDDPFNRARYDDLADELWEQMRDFAWWGGGALLIVALDAYVGAHLFNFDEDPVPVPNRWDEQFGPPGGDMPGAVPAPLLTVFRWRTTF